MVAGVLLGLGSLLTLGKLTLVSMEVLLRLLAGCCLVGVLIPWRWTGAAWGFERLEWHLFLIMGVGPTVFAALLTVNRTFHGPLLNEPYVIHDIVSTGYVWRVHLVDDALEERPGAREFYGSPAATPGDTLWIVTARGALGMPVVVERRVGLQRMRMFSSISKGNLRRNSPACPVTVPLACKRISPPKAAPSPTMSRGTPAPSNRARMGTR